MSSAVPIAVVIPVPDPEPVLWKIPPPTDNWPVTSAVAHLAAAYDAHAADVLLPLPQTNACSIRQALGQAVCTALDLDPETVATIRRHLAAEPSITAQRYAP